MKKLFFAAAILTAATLTGCGNKTNSAADGAADSLENVDSILQAGPEAVADSLIDALNANISSKDSKSLEATIASIKAKYDELVKSGKTEEAKTYAEKLKTYLKEHAEEVKTITSGNATVNDIVNTVVNIPTTTEEAASTVKNGVKEAVDNGKQAVENKVDEKKQEAKQKVNDAVNNASQKASDAVNKGLNKVLGN